MTEPQPADARLIIADSETNADLFYATRFLAPDPFVFLQTDAEKVLLMSDLELDRARSQAEVDTVASLSRYQEMARKSSVGEPTQLDALRQLLQERGIRSLLVPRSFPLSAADDLRQAGYSLTCLSGSFYPERECKDASEVEHIRGVQRHTERAMDFAIAAIREARIQGGGLYGPSGPLTAEEVKHLIAVSLMERQCTARNTIVACGDQACDPHNRGSGPLRADECIVIDIFPRSDQTGYCADITRTVVRGSPSAEAVRLYDTVLAGQELALQQIAAGRHGKEIHQAVVDLFEEAGYPSGEREGRMQGFFHGTGHGLGLEIHEPPRISKSDSVLAVGHVVTVEPGLYYPGKGAVRIEDLVVVTEDGCENLTSYPKEFQL